MLPLAVLFAAGCQERRSGEPISEVDSTSLPEQGRILRVHTKGRLADMAGAIAPTEERKIATALATSEQRGGRKVMVVTLSPTSGDSMEKVGWAVRGNGPNKPLLLLINPAAREVRIEGEADPALKAQAAGLVRAGLTDGRIADAVIAAVSVLERS